MAITWDDEEPSGSPAGITWDPPRARSPSAQRVADAGPQQSWLGQRTQQILTEAPNKLDAARQMLGLLFEPAHRVRQLVTAGVQATPGLRSLPTLSESMGLVPRGAEQFSVTWGRNHATGRPIGITPSALPEVERQIPANVLGTAAAAPIDPSTYAFLPFSRIASTPLRMAASGAVGALPAALSENVSLRDTIMQAGVAALLGGMMPGDAPMPRRAMPPGQATPPRATAPRGYAPESVYLKPEAVTLGEAEASAREASSLAQRQQPLNPPLRTAAELAMERPISGPQEPPEVTPSMFPRGTFDEPVAPRAIDYPEGRPPRTRTAEDITWDEPPRTRLSSERGAAAIPDLPRDPEQTAKSLAPVFYSQLERSIQERMPNAASGEQIMGLVRSSPGVKAEEVSRVGLEDFLRGKPKVTKAEVLSHIQENNVQVQEVVKGGNIVPLSKDKQQLLELLRGLPRRTQQQEMRLQNLEAEARRGGSEIATKFHSYQLPGGTNYRELLLTVPTAPKESMKIVERAYGGGFEIRGPRSSFPGVYNTRAEAEAALPYAPKVEAEGAFRSSHFDEPNVLAHVRFNDRVDAQGKKVLFIEEIQSDWGQKLRKETQKLDQNWESGLEAMKRSKRLRIVCP